MKRVITYGTYDLLHQGHINLLRRARALGDYLIVGVTNDSFDRERGKLNVRNNVLERVEAVRATGLADEIIIEDYVGQKIDDIRRYGVDVFAIGSDWAGKFDYLREYCEVVYLPRTEGISSTQLREAEHPVLRVGVVGLGRIAERFVPEAACVSGVRVAAVYDTDPERAMRFAAHHGVDTVCGSYDELLGACDAVYVSTPHLSHFDYALRALRGGRHVLCETPLTLNGAEARTLAAEARERGLMLMEANKTAHCPAFNHLIVMLKTGVIGEIVDIDASLSKLLEDKSLREFCAAEAGGAMFETASYPLLPAVKLFGTTGWTLELCSRMDGGVDTYTRGLLRYPHGVCSFKLGLGVKTEGNLVISGTRGYAYVPAPWWKTDYFELRYEDQNRNQKFFYRWEDAGLRYEIQEFAAGILGHRTESLRLSHAESAAMADMMEQFAQRRGVALI